MRIRRFVYFFLFLPSASCVDVDTNDILSSIVLCHGGYPVHGRKIHSIPPLYPQDISSTLASLVVINDNISRHCQMSLGVEGEIATRLIAIGIQRGIAGCLSDLG